MAIHWLFRLMSCVIRRSDIQDGTFAGKWIAENKNGRTFFNSKRAMLAKHPLETVGEKLRNEMLWKDAESGDAGLDAASK